MNLFAIFLFIGLIFILLNRYNHKFRKQRKIPIICFILISIWVYYPINPLNINTVVTGKATLKLTITEPIYIHSRSSITWTLHCESRYGHTIYEIREIYGIETHVFFNQKDINRLHLKSVIFTGHRIGDIKQRDNTLRTCLPSRYRYLIDLVSIQAF